jgi:hypothetical protein
MRARISKSREIEANKGKKEENTSPSGKGFKGGSVDERIVDRERWQEGVEDGPEGKPKQTERNGKVCEGFPR